jgi:tetratricopeptide (TPR) repeat protein
MCKKNIVVSVSLVVILIVTIVLTDSNSSRSEEITEQEGIGVVPEQARISCEMGLSLYKEAKFKLEAKRKFNEAAAKYEDAGSAFRTAIEIAPRYSEAHAGLGRVYFSQKNFSEARRQYEIVVNLLPNDMIARIELASAYEKEQKYDHSIEQLLMAISLSPDNNTKEVLKTHIEKLEKAKQ